jgi:hypothetical protein
LQNLEKYFFERERKKLFNAAGIYFKTKSLLSNGDFASQNMARYKNIAKYNFLLKSIDGRSGEKAHTREKR